MEEKYFLVQIKRTNGTYEKGVVVKDTLDASRQSYHAYLGAYGYGNQQGTDYVACYVIGTNGATYDMMVDNRIPVPTQEPEEPAE